jgi:hypothetical protein
MREHFISPFRCARGFAASAALAANFSIVSLFHDGAAEFAIQLRDLFVPFAQTTQFQAGFFQGSIGSRSMRGVCAVAGERQLPGAIFTSQQTALSGTADWGLGNSNFEGPVWEHEFPLAVLLPGWSFWVTSTVVNVAVTASFFWEAVYVANIQPPTDENIEVLANSQ